MNKSGIIKKLTEKTGGIYSEKFYSDLADDILRIKKYNLPDFNRQYDSWMDGLSSENRYYSTYIVSKFNMDNNTSFSSKMVLMIIREYCDHLGYTLSRGKDIVGRYFVITKFEPK